MFEIQTLMLGGYVNTWSDANERPVVFETETEARGALNEYLRDLAQSGGYCSNDMFQITGVAA